MFTRNSLSNQLKIWWPQLNLQSVQKKGVGEQFPNPAMGTQQQVLTQSIGSHILINASLNFLNFNFVPHHGQNNN